MQRAEQELEFFDTHAHLSSEEMIPNMALAIERAFSMGVRSIVNICTDQNSLERGLKISQKGIYCAGATPPHDVEKDGKSAFAFFEAAAKKNKIIAIGETGLEYFHPGLDRLLQKEILVRYLHLAAETKKPILFHCRDAFSDLFSIVDLEYPKNAKAMLHCFTGTRKEAEEVLKRGWMISFSGIVTFKKSESLREIAKDAPLSQIVLETDSPWLSPQSKRGKPNEPGFIIETAECIAKARNISLEMLASATTFNARQFFGV